MQIRQCNFKFKTFQGAPKHISIDSIQIKLHFNYVVALVEGWVLETQFLDTHSTIYWRNGLKASSMRLFFIFCCQIYGTFDDGACQRYCETLKNHEICQKKFTKMKAFQPIFWLVLKRYLKIGFRVTVVPLLSMK